MGEREKGEGDKFGAKIGVLGRPATAVHANWIQTKKGAAPAAAAAAAAAAADVQTHAQPHFCFLTKI